MAEWAWARTMSRDGTSRAMLCRASVCVARIIESKVVVDLGSSKHGAARGGVIDCRVVNFGEGS